MWHQQQPKQIERRRLIELLLVSLLSLEGENVCVCVCVCVTVHVYGNCCTTCVFELVVPCCLKKKIVCGGVV